MIPNIIYDWMLHLGVPTGLEIIFLLYLITGSLSGVVVAKMMPKQSILIRTLVFLLAIATFSVFYIGLRDLEVRNVAVFTDEGAVFLIPLIECRNSGEFVLGGKEAIAATVQDFEVTLFHRDCMIERMLTEMIFLLAWLVSSFTFFLSLGLIVSIARSSVEWNELDSVMGLLRCAARRFQKNRSARKQNQSP